jgi:endonuclease-3
VNTAKRRETFLRLQATYPYHTTELECYSPFELLVAVVLSVQATEVGEKAVMRQQFPVAT